MSTTVGQYTGGMPCMPTNIAKVVDMRRFRMPLLNRVAECSAFQLSSDKDLQINVFNVSVPESFFSAVITHSYYSIFYSAKAYLMKKGIVTKPPEEHKKTYYELKLLVDEGILDVELLMIYEQVLIRADTLLGIFKGEKRKRGSFTYQKISQANIDPATDSLKNSKLFFKHVYNLCDYDDQK